ncbi:MAG: choice-of-anchor Q domain-containing protein [Chitinophagales bacterium]
MKKSIFAIAFLCFVVALTSSCNKDKIYTSGTGALTFSEDTLTFDTVFTTLGTSTRFFKVENTKKSDVHIDKIIIAEGDASPFRLNVDGVTVMGTEIENVIVPADDYIYIFVEATLGENNQSDPLIILNELQYHYNGGIQSSYLRAWGQDAYFHYGEVYENENVIWQNDKPHVIVGNEEFQSGLGVDSFSTLTIMPGCRVYTALGDGILVDGELIVGQAGSMDSVVFEGDRQEIEFDDIPGQWFGIGLLGGSTAEFHNVTINEANYGIMARFIGGNFSSFTDAGRPDITLDKVLIKNTAQNALIGLNAKITAENCIFHSAGNNLVSLVLGGEYDFDNCTLYNSGGLGLSHDEELLAISDIASNGFSGGEGNLDQADFTNCIVYGTLQEEILINNSSNGAFEYQFENCLVKTLANTDTSVYINCVVNDNPQFESTSDRDFHLTENSPCIDAGTNNGVVDDYSFNTRTNQDIGAFEFQ